MGSRMRISTVVKARTIQTRFPGKLVEEPEGVCRGWDALALAELHGRNLAALVLDALLDLVQAGLNGLERLKGHVLLGLEDGPDPGEALVEHCGCWWRARWTELENAGSWLHKNKK